MVKRALSMPLQIPHARLADSVVLALLAGWRCCRLFQRRITTLAADASLPPFAR